MTQKRINYYGRIRPANIDDLSVQRVQAVAGVIQDVADIGVALVTQQQKKKAVTEAEAAAAQALETGIAPEEQDRAFSAINVYDQTYNEVLKKAYLAGAETQVREKINTLAVEFPDDYQTFNTKVTGLRNGVLEGLPEEYRPAMQITMDSLIGAQRSRVLAAQKTRHLQEADEQLVLSTNDEVNNAISALGRGEFVQAIQSVEKANILVDDRVASKAISPAAGEVIKRENTFKLRVGTARATLQGILDSDEPGAFTNAISYVSSLQGAPEFSDLTQVERDTLIDSARSDLSAALSLDTQIKTRRDYDRKIMQEQNYIGLAAGIISGDVGADTILTAAQTRLISSADYDKLNTQLTSKGTGTDDWDLVYNIQQLTAIDPVGAQRLIAQNDGANLTRKTAQSLMNTALNKGPLTTDRYKTYKRALQANLGQIDSITGKWTGKSTKELASIAMIQFDERVSAGEDPQAVFNNLYDISDITGYSTAADAEKALEAINAEIMSEINTLIKNNRLSPEDAQIDYKKTNKGSTKLAEKKSLKQIIIRLKEFEKANLGIGIQPKRIGESPEEVVDNG
jgi:hypothetical protein